MCGIAGVSELNDNTKRILPFLAYEMEERGDDSWGILTPNYIHKELGPITETWNEGPYSVLDLMEEGHPLSLHTRAGSVGGITQENSHPFVVVGSKCTVAGMHNGCVSNWKELETKHNVKYEVDSQFICHYIANGLDTSDIRGWGAFVWLQWENDEKGDPHGEPTLNFVRFNMTDFHIAKLIDDDKKTTLAWCSTKYALLKACRMADVGVEFMYDVQSETHYQYMKSKEGEVSKNKGFPLAVVGKMRFGFRTYQPVAQQTCAPATQCGGAKPKATDYEPGTNNVHKNPTTPTGKVNENRKEFSVGNVGRELREQNRCVICKVIGVDRTKRAICNGCVDGMKNFITDRDDKKLPDVRQLFIYGIDWEYGPDGNCEFIVGDDQGDNIMAFGC